MKNKFLYLYISILLLGTLYVLLNSSNLIAQIGCIIAVIVFCVLLITPIKKIKTDEEDNASNPDF